MKTFACLCILALVSFGFASGCATPGPKYIDLTYTGTSKVSHSGSLGISRFSDKRPGQDRGSLGHRVLNDNSRQVFLVQGLDLAGTLTNLTQTHLEKKGLTVTTIPAWSTTLTGMAEADQGTTYLLTADINAFECKAQKKGAVTTMVLDIDLTLFLGKMDQKKLTTIPVALTLERTDVNFTTKKLENFFNDALAEALEKALPLD